MTTEPTSVLVVAAHPDDEVLGAGIWLNRHASLARHILHITEGSPRDLQYARAAGFATRRSYALARRGELTAALRMIGIPESNCHRCNYFDQEVYLHLVPLIARLDSLIRELRPSIVISPAYEGGHPDHDAAAFAVAMIRRREGFFRHLEFPLYHAGPDGEMITGEFITGEFTSGEFIPASWPGAEHRLLLSPSERDLKARMLACFATQTEILNRFRVECESFRESPLHDFSLAPHPGPLLYERWGWPISGSVWRAKACEALEAWSRRFPTCVSRRQGDQSVDVVSASPFSS